MSDVHDNTAMGTGALLNVVPGTPFRVSGGRNTAAGSEALQNDTAGYQNTAFGVAAVSANTTGVDNTACGAFALGANQTGELNTASGYDALLGNTAGSDNTALGSDAMQANATGTSNTAVGVNALRTNQGGSNNIALGASAGYYVRGGRHNIEIGNLGTAQDAGTIRIGTSGQQGSTYIAGITSSQVTGSAVYVTATGQLGVLASSERYKTDVASLGSSTEKLAKLRAVSFRLKTDPKVQTQYGLIAEEVAKVYPELVIRGQKGQIEGVRYEELTSMLLNELQQQQGRLGEQQAELEDMRSQLTDLRRALQKPTQ